jgi:hypothetical protein
MHCVENQRFDEKSLFQKGQRLSFKPLVDNSLKKRQKNPSKNPKKILPLRPVIGEQLFNSILSNL